ncbi:2851_t:CDS:2 [Funneliformis caledonium]|uniref:2851_t:CDS:1 n=1 Tax=Funneliformis caledonium TaxID=1117310 RepID=A0A9N8V7Y1_9GLOM|nr:2851_t:CDS:2 [Funneliformis caledonium]
MNNISSQILYNLLTQNNSELDESYVTQIRAYNQVFTFTFLGVKLDEKLINTKKRIYTFRIQGELYYQIRGLMPRNNDQKLTFAQIYFYDSNMDNQLQKRQEIFLNLNAEMLKALQDKLLEINLFIKQFVTSEAKAKSKSNTL